MNSAQLRHFIHELWSRQIVPQLIEYIRIPNKSPAFDPDWVKHGYMDQAVCSQKARAQSVTGMKVEVIRLSGRTPLIFIEIPGQSDDCVLLYGHLDKQPEMSGWSPHLGPWTPVLEGEKLYGRGSADDGYALFGALAAIMALQQQDVPHARCVILIEACEESGSYDLPHYVDHLAARLGRPSLVVCLDSGCANYEQLWLTTSLRGLGGGVLTVRVLKEGVHSGDASGVVASAFRILRQLLSRLKRRRAGGSFLRTARPFPPSASSRRAGPRELSVMPCTQNFLWQKRCGRWMRTWQSWCSIGPGGRRCRSLVRTVCRRS